MKKKMIALLAGALMAMSASSAFAAFADLDLIRVYYERTTGTIEKATDLGNVKTLIATPSTTIAGSWASITNPNNLFVAYFAIDRTASGPGVGDLWVSGSMDTTKAPLAVGTLGFNTAKSGANSMYTYYNSLGTDTVTASQTNSNSYRNKLSASQGAISNAITIATRVNTEANLASLVNGTATQVKQKLYFFENANTANSKGVAVAEITSNADGSSTITTTPIPPAFFLMGSGLLGMFGLRRKSKAA